ncbi:MAG: hypothetical protein HY899_09700 [Deltaproteobacteria bacterium]|nr:hypothetical protein [Deltaproteobacteria bacterium]
MQLTLSFAQEPSDDIEPSPNVWETLQSEQRHETLVVLARLFAKIAAASAAANSNKPQKEPHDD